MNRTSHSSPLHSTPHPCQVWLASSLLADSLAVAAQTLLARSLAAGQQSAGKVVIGATLRMSLVLGGGLAACLALGQANVAALFSSDPAVLACLAVIMPAVVSAACGPAGAGKQCCSGRSKHL